MIVLSLFDGIAGAYFSLERAGIIPTKYYASEIKKWPIKIAKHNFPKIVHIGDVKKIKARVYPKIDLLIGGSPCTSLSSAKGQKESGLTHGESTLFWEYLRILDETKPKYFLLENVASMKTSDRNEISKAMGVEPIMICSSLVSAQMRKRLYWTNIPNVKQPKDRKIFLKDIIDEGFVDREKSYCLDANYFKGAGDKNYLQKGHVRRQIVFNNLPQKSLCLTSSYNKACAFDYEEKSSRQLIRLSGARQGEQTFSLEGKAPTLLGQSNGGEFYAIKDCLVGKKGIYRKLTVIECERLQGVPEGSTNIAPKTHAIRALGNGFQIDTVAHILSYMKKRPEPKKRIVKNQVCFWD